MSIKESIQADLKDAMKSGDSEKRDVLRMLDSMIKNVEIEKDKREDGLNDEEVLEVVGKAVKQRKDSIKQYTDGGRKDLADKEEAEIKFLDEYLPEQMGEDELKAIVKEEIQQSGAKDKSELGKVMGAIMAKVKGKADGNMVRKAVEDEFNSQE